MQRFSPQTKPTALEHVFLRDLVDVARRCYERGWVAGTAGNFSLCLRPGLMWISQSGVCKGQLNPDRFIPLNFSKGLEPIEPVYRKPSDETPLHAAILKMVPHAKAVVHVHAPSVVAASLLHQRLEFTGLEMQKALGCPTHEATLNVRVIDNTQDIADLAASLTFESPVPPVLILRGHGVYAWGRDPQQALNFVEGLEQLCQTIPHQG